MNVTYKDLKDRYILSVGDVLTLYGLQYEVCGPERYYLSFHGRNNNDSVFTQVFHMSTEEKEKWADAFAAIQGDIHGSYFPEFEYREDLTCFVISIYETCPYKIGDVVRIKDDKDFSGQSFVITQIAKESTAINGNIFKYFLVDSEGFNKKELWYRGPLDLVSRIKAITQPNRTPSSITDPSPSDCAVILKPNDDFSSKIVEPKKAIKVRAKHIKL